MVGEGALKKKWGQAVLSEAKQMGYRWYQIADMINRSKSDTQHLLYQVRNHIKTNDRMFMDRYELYKKMIETDNLWWKRRKRDPATPAGSPAQKNI